MDAVNEEEEFRKASEYIKSVVSSLDTSTKLDLYGLYKQVTEGPCNTPKPGFFDFQGKQKWEAWNKLGDMSKRKARMEYVEIVSKVCPDWQDKVERGEVKTSSTLGVSVSTMANSDPHLEDKDKCVFDWCIEDNMQQVCKMLDNGSADVNAKDENGMTLLHWACDRGYEKMSRKLLDLGASFNSKDEDGQTPLHYATSCEHTDVIILLLEKGADASAKDADGISSIDLAEKPHIKALLQPS